MLKVGDNAPQFVLLNTDGKSVSLNNFLGKKVVLWFFPKASTPGWIIEGQGFRDEFQNFNDLNVQIIGCSADPPKKQKKFCDKQGFQYPMLCDENHEMLKAYGVWGKKKFMGREYMGISRVTYIISEKGIIDKVYEKVKTTSHSQDILRDIRE